MFFDHEHILKRENGHNNEDSQSKFTTILPLTKTFVDQTFSRLFFKNFSRVLTFQIKKNRKIKKFSGSKIFLSVLSEFGGKREDTLFLYEP